MSTYNKIYVARIIVEADTPLFVGSGEVGLLSDMQVQRDHLGLPMILGTTLAGVLRNEFQEEYKKGHFEVTDKKREYKPSDFEKLFGYHEENFGQGSRIRVSSAYLMINERDCVQGLGQEINPNIFDIFTTLPIRPHVKINTKGVADKDNNALFFNEVVYKGSRFKFEIELLGGDCDKGNWDEILNTLSDPRFRIGMGTRKGYGALKIIELKSQIYEVGNEAPPTCLNSELSKTESTEIKCEDPNKIERKDSKSESKEQRIIYNVALTPEDFFYFGNDTSDTEVDNTPATESVIKYNKDSVELSKELTIIPASSIKGALAHRTAFYYNKLKKRFIVHDDGGYKCNANIEEIIGSKNEAVSYLFGEEANDKDKEKTGKRGRVIINDIFLSNEEVRNDKIFNHVAIDRFTGGAVDSALFSEKVSYFKDRAKHEQGEDKIKFDITLLDVDLDQEEHKNYISAFEEALYDMTTGLLPLGGMTTKGHGIFTGKYTRVEK